jgi:hypothetical protein
MAPGYNNKKEILSCTNQVFCRLVPHSFENNQLLLSFLQTQDGQTFQFQGSGRPLLEDHMGKRWRVYLAGKLLDQQDTKVDSMR